MTEKDNLLAVLIEARVDSRRKIADAIMHGRVRVNGEKVSDLRHPVDAQKDRIEINGKPVGIIPEGYVYIIMNKPEGILSTAMDDRKRRTAIDLLPEKYRKLKLYPAGRLDKYTTGLMLLTNDGELTNRVTHPRYEHEKEYYIRVDGKLKPEEMKQLEQGIQLDDGMTAPAKVRELKNVKGFNHSIVIHEGRKHQVRRMFLELGYRTIALKRVRIGNLTLGDLKEGEVRELSGEEVKKAFG